MNVQPTRNDRTEQLLIYSALGVYAVIWFTAFLGIATLHPIGAAAITVTYVALHAYENHVRGHCLLSADSSALPLTIVVTLAAVFIERRLSTAPPEFGPVLAAFGLATIGGHLVAIGWCAGWTTAIRASSRIAQLLRRQRA